MYIIKEDLQYWWWFESCWGTLPWGRMCQTCQPIYDSGSYVGHFGVEFSFQTCPDKSLDILVKILLWSRVNSKYSGHPIWFVFCKCSTILLFKKTLLVCSVRKYLAILMQWFALFVVIGLWRLVSLADTLFIHV